MKYIKNYKTFEKKRHKTICIPIKIYDKLNLHKYDEYIEISQKIQKYLISKNILTLGNSSKIINVYSHYIVVAIDPLFKNHFSFFDNIPSIRELYSNCKILPEMSLEELLNGGIDYMIEGEKLRLL